MSDARTQFTEFETELPPDAMADTGLADRKTVKARKKVSVTAEKDREATLAGLMSIPNGRRWMWWLLGLCHVGHQPAHILSGSGAIDVPRSFLNFGEMNIGNQLIAAIYRAAPDEYARMVKEANEKEEINAA